MEVMWRKRWKGWSYCKLFVVLADHRGRAKNKESEKREKYLDLAREIEKKQNNEKRGWRWYQL